MRENTMSEKLIIPKGYEVVRSGKLVCDMFFTSEVDGLGWEPYEGWENEPERTIEWHTELILIQPIKDKTPIDLKSGSALDVEISELSAKLILSHSLCEETLEKNKKLLADLDTERTTQFHLSKTKIIGQNKQIKELEKQISKQAETIKDNESLINHRSEQLETLNRINLGKDVRIKELLDYGVEVKDRQQGVIMRQGERIKELEAQLGDNVSMRDGIIRTQEKRIKELEADNKLWYDRNDNTSIERNSLRKLVKELEGDLRVENAVSVADQKTLNVERNRIKQLEGSLKKLRGLRDTDQEAIKNLHRELRIVHKECDKLTVEINDNHRRLKNQQREIRGHQEDFKKANPLHVLKEVDARPQRGGWAPGAYLATCKECGDGYIGDKRSIICADCAYKEPSGGIEKMPLTGGGKPIREVINALIDKVADNERNRQFTSGEHATSLGSMLGRLKELEKWVADPPLKLGEKS